MNNMRCSKSYQEEIFFYCVVFWILRIHTVPYVFVAAMRMYRSNRNRYSPSLHTIRLLGLINNMFFQYYIFVRWRTFHTNIGYYTPLNLLKIRQIWYKYCSIIIQRNRLLRYEKHSKASYHAMHMRFTCACRERLCPFPRGETDSLMGPTEPEPRWAGEHSTAPHLTRHNGHAQVGAQPFALAISRHHITAFDTSTTHIHTHVHIPQHRTFPSTIRPKVLH